MIIDIAFAPPLRRWQARLAEELRAGGHRVQLVPGARGRSLGFVVSAAIAIERRVFGPKISLFDPVATPDEAPDASRDRADLTIALDGERPAADLVITPVFKGDVGDRALLSMATSGEPPNVRIRIGGANSGSDLVRATLAVEDPWVLSRALDQILTRMVTLLLQAVRHFEHVAPPPTVELYSTPSNIIGPTMLTRMARSFFRKLANRVKGRRGPPNWQIAFRPTAGPHAEGKSGWPGEPFQMLAKDSQRFFADPMPFEHGGRVHVFFEEYAFAVGKGIISMIEIGDDGMPSRPLKVLEHQSHLSYPLVLVHGADIYMLPEMSGSSRIQLFRADPFPTRWVPDRVLVDDLVASDATPILHAGRWWLFTTVSGDGGSSWDQLCLYHAPDLFGPWEPHAGNPVLVDSGAARPAGAMWHDENGVLMRVAQDCRQSYGQAVVVCRVERLDEAGYAQTIVERLEAPMGFGADGIHTYNRVGDLEIIDLRS